MRCMTKKIAVFLAVIMALSLIAACARSGNTTPPASEKPAADSASSSPAASSDGETSESSSDGDSTDASKSVTLTYLPWGWGNNPNGDLSEYPVMAEIEKRTNVKIEVINVGSAGDASAKLAALMATDDLPDFVDIFSAELDLALYESKMLEPLDDLIEEYGTNYKTNMPTALEAARYFYPDGKIYRLPINVGTFRYNVTQPAGLVYVRWDLYQQIGAPEANTLEDYIDIAKRMLELEPTNADGQVNYGLIPWFKDDRTNWWGGPAWALGINMNNYLQWNSVLSPLYDPPALTTPDSLAYKVLHFWFAANQAG